MRRRPRRPRRPAGREAGAHPLCGTIRARRGRASRAQRRVHRCSRPERPRRRRGRRPPLRPPTRAGPRPAGRYHPWWGTQGEATPPGLSDSPSPGVRGGGAAPDGSVEGAVRKQRGGQPPRAAASVGLATAPPLPLSQPPAAVEPTARCRCADGRRGRRGGGGAAAAAGAAGGGGGDDGPSLRAVAGARPGPPPPTPPVHAATAPSVAVTHPRPGRRAGGPHRGALLAAAPVGVATSTGLLAPSPGAHRRRRPRCLPAVGRAWRCCSPRLGGGPRRPQRAVASATAAGTPPAIIMRVAVASP